MERVLTPTHLLPLIHINIHTTTATTTTKEKHLKSNREGETCSSSFSILFFISLSGSHPFPFSSPPKTNRTMLFPHSSYVLSLSLSLLSFFLSLSLSLSLSYALSSSHPKTWFRRRGCGGKWTVRIHRSPSLYGKPGKTRAWRPAYCHRTTQHIAACCVSPPSPQLAGAADEGEISRRRGRRRGVREEKGQKRIQRRKSG